MTSRKCLKFAFLGCLAMFLSLSSGVKAQSSGAVMPACANINTVTMLHQYADGSGGTVEQAQSLVWSPDGKQIAVWLQRIDATIIVSDPTNWLQVWDVDGGKLAADLEFDQYTYPTDIVWSADSSKVAVSFSNKVRIWAGGSDWSPTLFEIDDFDRFEQVIWSADGSKLLTANVVSDKVIASPKGITRFANVIHRWDVTTGELLDESPAFDQAFLTTDGVQAIVVSHTDDGLSVRTAEDDHVLWSLPGVYLAGSSFTDHVQRVATIMVGNRNTDISVWDIPTNRKLLDLTGEYFPAVTFSPNGRFLQTRLNMVGEFPIWDVETGEQVNLPTIDGYPLQLATWSPDNACAISGASKKQGFQKPDMKAMFIWSTIDPEKARMLDESDMGFSSPVWSPDSQRLAVIYKTPVSQDHGSAYPSPPPQFSTALYIWTRGN